jgi:hypothetical protein
MLFQEGDMINKKPLRKEYVFCRNIGEEAILYDSTTKLIHVINTTAYFVWNMCDGLRQIDDIVNDLAKSFEISDEDNVYEDVKKILKTFQDMELISGG